MAEPDNRTSPDLPTSVQVDLPTNEEIGLERPFDCAICLQRYNLPVEIPCGHSFCFLCIKGVCARNSRCPLCRQTVPADYFYGPKVLSDVVAVSSADSRPSTSQNPSINVIKVSDRDVDKSNAPTEADEIPSASKSSSRTSPAAWFYEGRNGWWRYDDRTLSILEEAYAKDPDATGVEAMISGFVYVVDFCRMVQFRKDEPSRRRRVRRDVLDEDHDALQAAVKGIAGIKLPNAIEARKKSES